MNELPSEIADVITAWNGKVKEIEAVDEQLADRDRRIAEFQSTLAELTTSHRALGVQRTELVKSAERLRVMAERGCHHEGIAFPNAQRGTPAPPSPEPTPLPPSTTTGPAAAIEGALNSGPLAVMGDPTGTRVDDPDGGGAPDTGPFHRGGDRDRWPGPRG